jgi:hypothetical protein
MEEQGMSRQVRRTAERSMIKKLLSKKDRRALLRLHKPKVSKKERRAIKRGLAPASPYATMSRRAIRKSIIEELLTQAGV